MDNGQVDPLRQGKRQPVKFLSAADEDLINAGISQESIFKSLRHVAPICLELLLPGEDNVHAPRQLAADRLECLPTHDDRMSHGQFPETPPVSGDIPRNGPAPADNPVFRHGGNNRDNQNCIPDIEEDAGKR
jgi:hypothetical protein